MIISVENSDKFARISVKDQIKSVQEAMEFKKRLQETILTNPDAVLEVVIEDSYVLPSSIIGVLLRYAEIEKRTITLAVHHDELIQSLRKLNFEQILNVKRR